MSRLGWESLPDGDRAFEEARQQAGELLAFVVRLVGDPARIERAARSAEREWKREGFVRYWHSANIDSGPLPAALFALHLERVEPNRGWSNLATAYLSKASRLPAPSSGLSLYQSPLSLGFVLGLRSEDRASDATASEQLAPFVSYLSERLDHTSQQPLTPGSFDLLSGLAGACLFLHGLVENGVAGAELTHRAATEKLAALAWTTGAKGTPPYWVHPEALPTDAHRASHPDGYTDLGVAHGISGALLALSLSPDARGHACALLEDVSAAAMSPDGVPWWPNATGSSTESATGDRFAWCYGTPGVSRTLYLSAELLDHGAARELAIKAARGVAARVIAGTTLPDPGICHGNAGLLQVMLRFANDLGDEIFWAAGTKLIGRIYRMHDAGRAAGFVTRAEKGSISSPCLLSGAIGVGLTLLSALEDVEPTWDRLLGLSVAGPRRLSSRHAPT